MPVRKCTAFEIKAGTSVHSTDRSVSVGTSGISGLCPHAGLAEFHLSGYGLTGFLLTLCLLGCFNLSLCRATLLRDRLLLYLCRRRLLAAYDRSRLCFLTGIFKRFLIYSIDRQTPAQGLEKVSREELEEIARRISLATDIKVQVA